MNENKHTQEPMFQFDFEQLARYENGRTPVLLTEEQYRRARACVNACAGIPTSRIEAGAADILTYSMELKKQRDEALELAKEHFDTLQGWQSACLLAEKQSDELLTELERVKTICLRELGNGVVNEVVLQSIKGES